MTDPTDNVTPLPVKPAGDADLRAQVINLQASLRMKDKELENAKAQLKEMHRRIMRLEDARAEDRRISKTRSAQVGVETSALKRELAIAEKALHDLRSAGSADIDIDGIEKPWRDLLAQERKLVSRLMTEKSLLEARIKDEDDFKSYQIKQTASALELQVRQLQAVIAQLRKTKGEMMIDLPEGLGKVAFDTEESPS